MIGIAFEVHDTWKLDKEMSALDDKSEEEKERVRLQTRHRAVNPSSMDVVHYALSHAGLLTGEDLNSSL